MLRVFLVFILFAIAANAKDRTKRQDVSTGGSSVSRNQARQLRSETTNSNEVFAHEIFSNVARENKFRNIVLSPYVISAGLSMTLLGAKGKTAKEIMVGLKYSGEEESKESEVLLNQDNVHFLYQKLAYKLEKSPRNGTGYELNIANRLFGQKTETFTQKFIEETERYYNAKLKRVNFMNNPDGSRRTINNYVSSVTNNKIQDFLGPDAINSQTLMCLVSAIYFQGKWLNRFDPDRTITGPFTTVINDDGDTRVSQVQYMTGTFSVKYSTNDEYGQKVILPYEHGRRQYAIQMELYLPRDYTWKSVATFENAGVNDLDYLFSKESTQPLALEIPKFSLDYETDLKSILASQMKISTLFTENADLSGMNNKHNLWIGTALQKAFIEVSEEGTEAGAVYAESSNRNSGPEILKFDRTFHFIIRAVEPNTILFIGRVAMPVTDA